MFKLATMLSLLVLMFMLQDVSGNNNNDDVDFLGFHTVATMPYNCSDMTATTFEMDYGDSDGSRIYLVGGCIADQICEITDPDSGAIFCYCPEITNQCIYFTPDTEEWHTDCSSAPTDRYRHMAVKIDQYLWLLGGRTVEDDLITSVERYDTTTDTWTTPFNWTEAVSDAAAFAANDGIIYVVGGYDAAYNTLSQLIAIDSSNGAVDNSLPSMFLGRGDLAVIQFQGNNFWVVGGWNAETSNGFCDPSTDVEVFNTDSLTWRNASDLENGRGDLVLGIMDDGIFAVGGETKNQSSPECSYSIPVKIVERHLDDNGYWNDEEDIPSNIFRFSGASYNSTGDNSEYLTAIYLFGGQGSYNEVNKTFPLLGSTIKYIPTSTGSSKKSSSSSGNDDLSAGGIAGITIAVVIVVACIIAIIVVAVLIYWRKRHYTQLDDNAANGMEMGGIGSRVQPTMRLIITILLEI